MVKDRDIAVALMAIARSEEGKTYIQFLREELTEADMRSRHMTGEALILKNGERINLEKMIKHFEAAGSTLERIENKSRIAKDF